MIKYDETILKISRNMSYNSHNDIIILGFGDPKNKIKKALIIDLDKLCEEENISPKWSELNEEEQIYLITRLEYPEIEKT